MLLIMNGQALVKFSSIIYVGTLDIIMTAYAVPQTPRLGFVRRFHNCLEDDYIFIILVIIMERCR